MYLHEHIFLRHIPTIKGSCPYIHSLQLEKTVAMTLKADAAVVSVKCAPAAEPFPNERSKGDPDHVCSGPRETQDQKKTH